MKAPEYKIPLAGSDRAALPGFRPVRAANPSAIIDVSVVLRPRSDDDRSKSVTEMSSQLPQERHYLTREQYAEAHGADSADINKIARFAARHGLRVVDTDAAARTVQLRGTVAALSRAFSVELTIYRRAGPQAVQRYRGRTGPIYIPAELEGIVEAVTGLDNRPQAMPR
jgi:kumamolisin